MNNQQYRPNLLDVPVSVFTDAWQTQPEDVTTLRRIVSTSYYRQVIEAIRAEPDEDKQKERKKQLRAFTPVALLRHRKGVTSFAEKISQQWPLLMGDIDEQDNPHVDMAELKQHLCRLPYLMLCAHSVRGGLWFVVRLPHEQTPDTLAAHFRYLQRLFSERFGIMLDASKGSNPTALRYVSYDAAPYFKETAIVMTGRDTPPPPKPQPRRYAPSNAPDEEKLLTRLVRSAEGATTGNRHETLLKAATVAGGYVATGRMNEQTAIYALETVASEWPMFSKSQKTIRDGIRFGLQKPLYAGTISEFKTSVRLTNKTILPTARPPIWPLAVSSINDDNRPCWIRDGQTIYGDTLPVESCDSYPAEWDAPNPLGALPTITAKSFRELQYQHSASLQTTL